MISFFIFRSEVEKIGNQKISEKEKEENIHFIALKILIECYFELMASEIWNIKISFHTAKHWWDAHSLLFKFTLRNALFHILEIKRMKASEKINCYFFSINVFRSLSFANLRLSKSVCCGTEWSKRNATIGNKQEIDVFADFSLFYVFFFSFRYSKRFVSKEFMRKLFISFVPISLFSLILLASSFWFCRLFSTALDTCSKVSACSREMRPKNITCEWMCMCVVNIRFYERLSLSAIDAAAQKSPNLRFFFIGDWGKRTKITTSTAKLSWTFCFLKSEHQRFFALLSAVKMWNEALIE